MSVPVRFPDLVIPAPLQRALEARGYDTATPVQAAVLAAAASGRDLLVSSQTGSGKTIAFGAALAGSLLDAAAGTPAPRAAGAPRALVIVPTRELVAQVREELGWLLAGTALRLASFTGGTAVGGDLRALHRGVDVAIGTPGRLVDLMRREKLALGQLEVVVLDEADEMLDLGFREDLEILLGAAPVARRTLLLSATLPAEIRSLARRFQRDALALDPRKGGAEPGAVGRTAPGAHEDITYAAHLIAGGDRLAAVVNLLRASEDARAIVFCTTREAVGSLHRELLARGFAATAISGERAQAERDRALDQVRQGEARILVATNVAARGLHLPDVDLIVHADLPLNAESLTHRSGRTGRAGRKGTAVVIASLAERRKAERLLAAAQVRVAWTAPPSGKQIAAAARTRLIESLLAESGAGLASPGEGEPPAGTDESVETARAVEAADDLLAPFRGKISTDDLARRLLARELDRLPVGETLLPVILPSAGGDRRFGAAGGEPPARRRGPGDIARDGVMFRVNLGAKDQADPRWLLPLICRRGGVTRREVGAIRVGPQETLFEITGDAARDFALAASQVDPRAPQVRMERVGGGPAVAAAEGAAGPPPRHRTFDGPPRAAPGGRAGDRPPPGASRGRTFDGPSSPRAEMAPARRFGAPPPGSPPDAASGPSPLPAHDRPHQRRSDRAVQPVVEASPRVNGVHLPPVTTYQMKLHPTKPHRMTPHPMTPHLATPHAATPHAAKPHQPKSHDVKPHATKPYQARPYQTKGHPGRPLPGKKPYAAKPYAAKPYQPKPYAAKPHAKSHPAKAHGPRDPDPRPPGGKRKG